MSVNEEDVEEPSSHPALVKDGMLLPSTLVAIASAKRPSSSICIITSGEAGCGLWTYFIPRSHEESARGKNSTYTIASATLLSPLRVLQESVALFLIESPVLWPAMLPTITAPISFTADGEL